jgi:hypothetical protein
MMPVSRARIEQRRRELKSLDENPSVELLRGLGANWVIYPCSELPKLPAPVRSFLEGLKARGDVEFRELSRGPQDCFQVYFLKDRQ